MTSKYNYDAKRIRNKKNYDNVHFKKKSTRNLTKNNL